MSKQVTLMTDAIPYQEFAKLIGKSTGAVRRMIDKGKLPVIDMPVVRLIRQPRVVFPVSQSLKQKTNITGERHEY